jgi:hypothetical protein
MVPLQDQINSNYGDQNADNPGQNGNLAREQHLRLALHRGAKTEEKNTLTITDNEAANQLKEINNPDIETESSMSKTSMSNVNRFRIRPRGVVSK